MARNDQKGKSKSQKSGTKNGADKAAAEDESVAQGSARSAEADKGKGKGNGGAKAEPATPAKAAKAARATDEHEGEAPRAAAPPPSHDHSAHGHHAPNRKEYWKIFGVLLVLTVLEVVVAQVPGIGKTTLGVTLVAMAIAKAGIVALYYMHLKHETKVLRFWVAIPFAAPAVYALALIADAAWRHAK
jgi:cytochrome c oxidase subunit 4